MARSILNGVVGDYLAATDNDLAIDMGFYRNGQPLDLASSSAVNASATKICILVHGLTDNETTWSFPNVDDDDYGQSLQRDFGMEPYYLRYNSGLHVSTNGKLLCRLMQTLFQQLSVVEEIVFLCHSMGGLVVRSACCSGHDAGCDMLWTTRVSRIVFLATPHQGSYWEKAGNVVANALGAVPRPYMKLAEKVANLRSAGIKDLRFGYVKDDDWNHEDSNIDALLVNTKKKTDLLEWTRHYIVTGTVTKNPRHPVSYCLGDALVRKASAEGHSNNKDHDLNIPSEQRMEFAGLGHVQLSRDANVYNQIKEWIQQPWDDAPAELKERNHDGDLGTPSNDGLDTNDILCKSTSTSTGKWAQRRGVATLVQHAVDKGATAVEGVQQELTSEVYNVLSLVTPIAPVVRSVQVVHEACVGSVYSMIRGVNRGVGETAKYILIRMDEVQEN